MTYIPYVHSVSEPTTGNTTSYMPIYVAVANTVIVTTIKSLPQETALVRHLINYLKDMK